MPCQPCDDIDRRIGQAIRLYRRVRNLTQGQLGHALGITAQQVQKFETGRNHIAVSRLFHIGAALRVPIEVFLIAVQQEPPSGSLAGPRQFILISRQRY